MTTMFKQMAHEQDLRQAQTEKMLLQTLEEKLASAIHDNGSERGGHARSETTGEHERGDSSYEESET
jgi:hypothetical protein